MVEPTMDPVVWLRKQLEEADVDLLREMVPTFIQALMERTIFAQPSAEEVAAQLGRVTEQPERLFPAAAELLAQGGPDVSAFSSLPTEHWRQIWSNNPQERLNREIRRRTDVVGIFPNRAAIVRLMGGVLAEQHDEWAVARRYVSQESLRQGAVDGDRRGRR